MSKRICERDGCEVEVSGRSKRCPEHQAEHRREKQRARESDRRRRSASAPANAHAAPASAHADSCALAPETLPAELSNLGPRQRRFALIFAALGNATEAAKQAGYSENSARSIGAENLTKPDILAAVRALHAREEAARGDVAASGVNRLHALVLDGDGAAAEAARYLQAVVRGEAEADAAHVAAAGRTLDRHDAAAFKLLDRRDRRELLEFRERLKREATVVATSGELSPVEQRQKAFMDGLPEPAHDEASFMAALKDAGIKVPD